MKKLFLTLACGIGMIATSNAQLSLAPVLGLNLSNATVKPFDATNPNSNDKIITKTKLGIHAGVAAFIGLTDNLSFNPNVLYSSKGYSYANKDTNLTMNYLEVPLNIVYMLGTEETGRLMIHAGPYAAYLLNAKVKETTVEVGNDKVDALTPLDFGAQLGVGYKLPMGLFARAQGQFGLTNVFNANNPAFSDKAKNSFRNFPLFALTVGYMFDFSK